MSPGRASTAANAPLDTGWRLALGSLSWLAGIGAQLQQPALWPLPACLVLLLAALGLAAAWWCLRIGRRRAAGFALPCLPLGLALAGFSSTGWRATQRMAQALPAALEGQDLQLTGVIVGLPQPGLQGTRFVLRVEHAQRDDQPVTVPQHVSLGWYRGFDGEALLAAPLQELRAGQRWLLTVRLRQPHGSFNPGGFDLELRLFEQGLRASGAVRATAGAVNRKLADAVGQPVDRARQAVRDAILLRVADAQAAGVLAALAVGDQAAIDREDWDLFRDTGVAHLMSISGSTRYPVRLARRRLCAARRLGRAGAAHAVDAGHAGPVAQRRRSLARAAGAAGGGRRGDAARSLDAAAAGLLAVLRGRGAADGVGTGLGPARAGRRRACPPAAARSAPRAAHSGGGQRRPGAAEPGVLPAGVAVGLRRQPAGHSAGDAGDRAAGTAGHPGPAAVGSGQRAGAGLVAVLELLALGPLGLWTAAAAPAWGMAVGLLGGTLLVLPLPWRLRLLGLPLLLPLLAPPLQRPAVGEFEVIAADVGQGTAVLVRTRNHLLLYDSGPRYSAEADAAQRVLLPLLRSRGENHIDLLLLSHRDIDHVGGAASLLAEVPVASMLSSLPETHPLLAAGVPHRRCVAGQAWDWDGVRLELLHPLPGDYLASARPNTLSCVLRVQGADGRSLLLTGDIESAQEAALVARLGPALRSQVLLVPHHGSKTSSSEAFIGAAAPGTAVVQAAYLSRFGHPAPEVLARYQALGVELRRSDACGAWIWDARGVARCQREVAARYWHHRVNAGPGAGP